MGRGVKGENSFLDKRSKGHPNAHPCRTTLCCYHWHTMRAPSWHATPPPRAWRGATQTSASTMPTLISSSMIISMGQPATKASGRNGRQWSSTRMKRWVSQTNIWWCPSQSLATPLIEIYVPLQILNEITSHIYEQMSHFVTLHDSESPILSSLSHFVCTLFPVVIFVVVLGKCGNRTSFTSSVLMIFHCAMLWVTSSC